MKRKNEAHELVLQCLTEALLKLMEKKPFNEINVSELCEKAGVARASFYRNYDSMQEILTNYLSSVTDDGQDEQTKYLCAMVAGAIYGFVEQWIVLGMNDIPDTINMRKFLKFVSEYKVVSVDEK